MLDLERPPPGPDRLRGDTGADIDTLHFSPTRAAGTQMTTRTKTAVASRTANAKAKQTTAVAGQGNSKAKQRPSLRAARTNKHGQALGRKGAETRLRLMDAARQLLVDHSPMELTAVSIAKAAATSSPTFYIYFEDVRELMLALSEQASADLAEVHRVLEEDWDPEMLDPQQTVKVVNTFNGVWDRHRNILRFRNLEADRGDRSFLDQRIRSSIRIIDRFVDRIMAAYPRDHRPPRGDAYAEATALFAAMEGLAETDPAVVEEWQIGNARLARAMAVLLTRSFTAQSTTELRSANSVATASSSATPAANSRRKRVPASKLTAR